MTTIGRIYAGVTALTLGAVVVCGLSACSGASASAPLPPYASQTTSAPYVSGATAVLQPASLSFFATGVAQTVTVRQQGGAAYRLSTGCAGIATFAAIERRKNFARYSVTSRRAGACRVRFSDGKKHGATLPIAVTTTAIALAGSSVGPHALSASAVLGMVSATTALAGCAQGCTIAAPPSKPGSSVYTVTLYDAVNGTGNVLARGAVKATILAAKANVVVAAPLRLAATATFGNLPVATSGTAFAPVTLSLAVKDADGDTISGTFVPPVVVTDGDTSALSQGSSLTLNGAVTSRSVTVTSSSNVLALGYGGLAIAPANIVATVGATILGQTPFAPAVTSVAYQGTNDGGRSIPEIDLYSTTSGQPGYSGAFSLIQTGWSTSPYLHSFSFVASGTNNNCSSFAIVQTPGSSTYTVSPTASPKPGVCTMMLTGATSSSSAPLVLTFTNPVPVTVSTRHSPSRH